MLLTERSLIAVADGRQVRLIEERRRGGPLHERDDWSAGLTASHPIDGQGAHDKAEDQFLVEVATRVGEVTVRQAFDGVVVIAPPRALGQLCSALPVAARSRLRHTEAKERVTVDLDALHAALADMRRRGG